MVLGLRTESTDGGLKPIESFGGRAESRRAIALVSTIGPAVTTGASPWTVTFSSHEEPATTTMSAEMLSPGLTWPNTLVSRTENGIAMAGM
jgi:hypothetical protein